MARKGRDQILDLGAWFILRMGSADTLPVVKALNSRGLTVWTPVERKFGRRPRTKANYEKAVALLPTYAFAHVEHLDDVLRLAMLPTKHCGNFSVFHHKGGIPLIADDQLGALRAEEGRILNVFERWKNKGVKVPRLADGSTVGMTEGPFAGMRGVVEGSEGQNTLVRFPGFHMPIKVASLLLRDGMVATFLSDAA